MIFNPPFGYSPFSSHYAYQRREWERRQKERQKLEQEKKEKERQEQEKKKLEERYKNEETREYVEIMGLRLYFDDILIICLLFFLYQEGVKDESLFLSLILLLLS